MPLTLMLDVGAMLQLIVLIIEEHNGTGELTAVMKDRWLAIWRVINACGRLPAGEKADENGLDLLGMFGTRGGALLRPQI